MADYDVVTGTFRLLEQLEAELALRSR